MPNKNRSAYLAAVVAVFIVAFALGFFAFRLLEPLQGNGVLPSSQSGTLLTPSVSGTGMSELPTGTYSASVNIVAVTPSGEGVTSSGKVDLQPGLGRVLFNVNPFVEPDTQYSVQTAKKVAEKFTDKSLAKMDAIYSVEDSPAQLIGGPSAGAAFTLATIAAIEQKKVRGEVAITGTIQEDGTIGPIGGVVEKAIAVAKEGKKIFLVPLGQRNITYYEREVKQEHYGGFIIERINYVPKQADLNAFIASQYNTQVIEVKNITEAAQLALA